MMIYDLSREGPQRKQKGGSFSRRQTADKKHISNSIKTHNCYFILLEYFPLI